LFINISCLFYQHNNISRISPAGCGGSLIAANNIHTITCAGSFWWIIFSLGLVASLRAAVVRVRKRG